MNQGTNLIFATTFLSTTNTAERMRIDSLGNVGIGTSSPANKLNVVGGAGTTVAVFSDGTASCSVTPATVGAVSCTSDERLKRDIAAIAGSAALDKILQLRPVQYRWRGGDQTLRSGFVAQEVERVTPELVLTAQDGYKQVGYMGFIPWLAGATQEVSRQQQEDRAEIAALKAKNADLERRILRLESRH
jgi:hypothetical protein